VAFVAIIGLVILTAIVTVLVPPLGAILILIEVLAAVPVALYLTCRLILTDMAIFDGFGPIEGIRESWRLSNGAVLRLLGWGVMAALITWAFGLIAGMVSLPFSFGALAPVGQGFSSGMTAVASCLTIYMMAIIYESQRARLDPTVYGPVPAPAYTGWGYPGPGPVWPGAAGAPPAWPSAPGTPPAWPGAAGAPPAWSGAAGTPSPWPSPPADSTAIPGWVNPNAAPSWPQSAPPGWGQPAPGWPQSAPPGWGQPAPGWGQPAPGSAPKPEEGGQTPPSAPKPPEPPASS
jgi:hypothetical protein